MSGRRVLLLRGVNLGARNKVPMARLRELLGTEGFSGVGSYLQSGNVLVDDDGTPETVVADRVSALVLAYFDVVSPCVVRSAAELRATVAAAGRPGAPALPDDPQLYTVVFLAEEPDPDLVAGVDPADHEEEFLVVGRDVHVLTPLGTRNARLSHAFWERRLRVTATARNWRTVTALDRLLAAADG
ncbi:DUF1697 domain-containing protein [Aquipuribacter nitratireducens]|uniref:DUF1697 domain-containing protein n=1 Tax=Aquipuribacter nitratireducens TaxID=650104 RepID=A0ABW0GNQ3_9MICO